MQNIKCILLSVVVMRIIFTMITNHALQGSWNNKGYITGITAALQPIELATWWPTTAAAAASDL